MYVPNSTFHTCEYMAGEMNQLKMGPPVTCPSMYMVTMRVSFGIILPLTINCVIIRSDCSFPRKINMIIPKSAILASAIAYGVFGAQWVAQESQEDVIKWYPGLYQQNSRELRVLKSSQENYTAMLTHYEAENYGQYQIRYKTQLVYSETDHAFMSESSSASILGGFEKVGNVNFNEFFDNLHSELSEHVASRGFAVDGFTFPGPRPYTVCFIIAFQYTHSS